MRSSYIAAMKQPPWSVDGDYVVAPQLVFPLVSDEIDFCSERRLHHIRSSSPTLKDIFSGWISAIPSKLSSQSSDEEDSDERQKTEDDIPALHVVWQIKGRINFTS
jgi:hypothetical protein